jgi:hypothetical protein
MLWNLKVGLGVLMLGLAGIALLFAAGKPEKAPTKSHTGTDEPANGCERPDSQGILVFPFRTTPRRSRRAARCGHFPSRIGRTVPSWLVDARRAARRRPSATRRLSRRPTRRPLFTTPRTPSRAGDPLVG